MRTALGVVVAALVAAQGVDAQPRASERGNVSQIVNGTTVTVDYSRPVARGRTNLFGGVVHWGELWTPGANWATTLTVDRPVEIDGHPLEPGTYSVWIRLNESEPWTFTLHSEPRLYHDEPVPDDGTVLAFPVEPKAGAHMETLAWYFPVVGPREATLHLHWGTTVVPLTVTTRPFEWSQPPADRRARFAGAYAVDGTDPTTGGPLRFTFTIVDDDGELTGRWGRAPVALVPVADDEFRIGFMRNGALFDVGDEMTLRVVDTGDGPAQEIELRWERSETFARGPRTNAGSR